MLSVYLPDSGKSDFIFESALNRLAAGITHLLSRHRPHGIIIAGDFNVELVPAVSARDIIGACLWPSVNGSRYSERQDLLMAFCARFGLIHGPSHLAGTPLERWTRESWGNPPVRTSLDHALLSPSLLLERWSPWPSAQWSREKHKYWGDHRPILASVVSAHGCRDQFFLDTPNPHPSFKGWQCSNEGDDATIRARLESWLERHGEDLLAAYNVTHDRIDVARAMSDGLVDVCCSVPYTTMTSRRGVAVHPPAQLRSVRRNRGAIPAADTEALRANRREERALIREWETRKLSTLGGLRQARFRDSWRSISFVQFGPDRPPSCNRDEWRTELRHHWNARFGDPLDVPSARQLFCARLFGDAANRPVKCTLGEVVLALASAKHQSAGGPDGPVAEMLHVLPLSLVRFVRNMFNARFALDCQGCLRLDAWRCMVADWIRKDDESDLLGSFRPIMRSSVFLKWIERVLMGPGAVYCLLHRAPLWGFRPRLSSSMLCMATSNAVRSLLQYHDVAHPSQGVIDGVFMTVDVEKAFDKMTMDSEASALIEAGFPPDRIATLVSELVSCGVYVRLGDVEVGPLPHSRGKQGGCSTPLGFSAVLAAALAPLVRQWRSAEFGIPLVGSNARLCCAVFADNVLLCGSFAHVVSMYTSLTRAIHEFALNWKPSSFGALGPRGRQLVVPAVGPQPSRTITCAQQFRWLGQVVAYEPGWECEHDACFAAATDSWNRNRRWYYSRKLTLRARIRMFNQSTVSVLVTRLSQLPCSSSVLQRARRWENRCLRALVGATGPFVALADFANATRRARRIAMRVGHRDVVTECLSRHFAVAGQWARIPLDNDDLAMRDFRSCWVASLESTWRQLQAQGVRRAAPGRPRPCWDSFLHEWSGGAWVRWAHCAATWQSLLSSWLQWAIDKAGVTSADLLRPLQASTTIGPSVVDHGIPSLTIAPPSRSGLFFATDSLVLARTLQGKWALRSSWLASLVRSCNDAVDCVMEQIAFNTEREGWWISHTSRRHNGWADALSKFARLTLCPITGWIHSASLWRAWHFETFCGG